MTQVQAPILLFPTHYLGNFVLGLPWVKLVLKKHPTAVVVLDAQFIAMAKLVLPDDTRFLIYPRQKISRDQKFLSRIKHYWRFLSALRSSKSDTILDLEGERFTGVLARLSGCKRRVGHAAKRAETFYTDILPVKSNHHRFKVFGEIVADYVDDEVPDSLLPYELDDAYPESIAKKLRMDTNARPLVAIHPGASVPYKLWPQVHFVELVKRLSQQGWQVVWVGAGKMDSEIITAIEQELDGQTISLCNQLSFVELIALYKQCSFFVGGDSGPMHLAASTGLPVFALFGPSNEVLWSPLGTHTNMLRGVEPCGANCDAFQCDFGYRCLQSLQPAMIMEAVAAKGLEAPASTSKPRPHSRYEKIPVSAYIITLNEAENIGACLDRLVEFDEVILVDSGSTDGTVEIANQYPNVKSSFNQWPGFSAQKAHALSLCENEWVLNVDADEIITDEYIEELKKTVAENRVVALESSRTLYRWGTRPRSFDRLDRLIRLFKKDSGHYEPKRVHECISIDGEIATTNATIEHYENLTYTQRMDKSNKYSEAKALDKYEDGGKASVIALVVVFPLTFIQIYFFKGHFLNGVDGLLTSMNAASYNFMKYAKLWELHKGRNRK